MIRYYTNLDGTGAQRTGVIIIQGHAQTDICNLISGLVPLVVKQLFSREFIIPSAEGTDLKMRIVDNGLDNDIDSDTTYISFNTYFNKEKYIHGNYKYIEFDTIFDFLNESLDSLADKYPEQLCRVNSVQLLRRPVVKGENLTTWNYIPKLEL